MVSQNKKNRRNKRNNKKNKLKRERNTEQANNLPDEDPNTSEVVIDDIEQEVNSGDESRKRHHTDGSDSDAEDIPKRKKKKNKPAAELTGDKKGNISIRKMKREKHAQRVAEERAASKDQLKSQCLNYLSQWKHDKQNWKFMKAKQVWLYKNKFRASLLPDSSWPLLLEYFESTIGNIRNLLLEDANKIIKQHDEWLEAQNGKDEKAENEDGALEDTDGPKKPDETSYKRARDIIQCLEE